MSRAGIQEFHQPMTNSAQIIQKLWSYCNVLRDDGLSYGDYVEQLTFLLFLKMADERLQLGLAEKAVVPKGYDWPSLVKRDGDDLETHYRHILEHLGKQSGMLGQVFLAAAFFLLFARSLAWIWPGSVFGAAFDYVFGRQALRRAVAFGREQSEF